jgi:hypothetical protein
MRLGMGLGMGMGISAKGFMKAPKMTGIVACRLLL